ncbi:MAG: general secretion pathway protein GspK [Thermodesulfobacteriota bacterium]
MSPKGTHSLWSRVAGTPRGIALLMTLWVVVLLAIIGATFALSMRTGLTSVRNFKEDAEAYYEAVAAYEDAVRFLMNDPDRSVDFEDPEGRLVVETEGEAFEGHRELDFGTVDVRINDESAKLNLNTASRNAIMDLLLRSGVEDKAADELADPDDERLLNGAETDHYESEGYVAKNGPFSTIDELLMVKGMDIDVLFGNPERELTGIYGHLSICPQTGMNVNTVSAETMSLLGVPYTDIESILLQRANGPVLVVPASARKVGITATASDCFRIAASAKPAGTEYTRSLEAFVRREPHGAGYKVRVLQWRDDV